MAIALLGSFIIGQSVLGSGWQSPKTNWISTDRFNIGDYNRIKNNILFLCEKVNRLHLNYPYIDMGDDITSYEAFWDVDMFNAFEQNLEKINNNILTKDYGVAVSFYENGPFIKWDELNRIESACLSMKDILERQEQGLLRLSFRLGSKKGVRV